MAFPVTIDNTTPTGSTSPGTGDNDIVALKQLWIDLLGVPASPSTVSAALTLTTTSGEMSIPIRLTNQTGVSLVAGDVVGIATANNKAVVLADTLQTKVPLVVALEAITNTSSGLFAFGGLVNTLNVTGTVTRGDYLWKSATTKVAADSATIISATTSPPLGAFAVALSADSGGACSAYLFPASAGSGGGGTKYIPLSLEGARPADGTGSGNAAPAPALEVSATAQTTNSPKVLQLVYYFDAAADEHLEWTFMMPGDYSSGGTLRIKAKAFSATTNDMVWKAAIAPITDSSTDDDATVFNTVGTVTLAAPGTQGQTITGTIALTVTGVSANRKVTIFIGRDADNAADTMAGDAVLVAATLEYTPT